MAKSVTETSQETNSVTLKRDAKGNYGWEIKVYGDEFERMKLKIDALDAELRKDYIEGA